jgi:hypothetical protein
VSWSIHPGAPFWGGFTAFCANEATLFALDKLDVLTLERAWLSFVSSFFVGGIVYGRAKVDEIRTQIEEEKKAKSKRRT